MTERRIEAIGHSVQGSFIDFAGDPAAVLVSPTGDVFLGAGALPGLPVDGAIERNKISRFLIEPSPTLGEGWILELSYLARGVETTVPLGLWTGQYSELWDWFLRVNEAVGSPVERPRSINSSAISRILKRGKVLAVPAWALSSASGQTAQEYKRIWMQAFLSHVCRILTVQYGLPKELTWEFAQRTPSETWLTVFNRLTPRIADSTPHRAIDVCFEPLFLSLTRGAFDIVRLGRIDNFIMVYRGSNPRMIELESRLDEIAGGADLATPTNASGGPTSIFDAGMEAFKEVAFAAPTAKRMERGPPLKILSQVGTISDETVSDLVAMGSIEQSKRSPSVDLVRLIDEMHKSRDFVLFCDEILLGDVKARWAEVDHEELETRPFPLPEPIPVGLPYAAGDTEWSAVLKEALWAVARSDDPVIRESWKRTIAEFMDINIEIDPEFTQASQRHHA